MRAWAGRRTAMIFVAGLAGVALAAGPNLEDVLSRKAGEFPAACSNVGFADAWADSGALSEDSLRLLPPNPEGPTPVDVFLFVLAMDAIDPRTDSFRFEGYGGMVWCDPRLAFEPELGASEHRRHASQQALDYLERIWDPEIFLPTQVGEPQRTNELLAIQADGTVRVTVKFNTRLSAHFDYRDFPLDRQRLIVPLQSLAHRSDAVALHAVSDMSGLIPGLDMPEWSLTSATTRIVKRELSGGGPHFDRFEAEILVARRIGFYIWKVAIPLLIIFAVSWSVFWMTRDVLAQRQRQTATAILTLVAFQFVAAGLLPRVAYLTLMDSVILWSFFVIAMTLPLNIWSVRGFRENPDIGLRRDRRWRWLYPTAYVVGLALILAARVLTRALRD